MTRIFIIIILTTFYLKTFGQDTDSLYTIKDNNLYGYIDKTGKTVIKPKFLSAGQFSEGLAPVRLNGTYGYINSNGNFIISPKFDFALSFYNGLAKVFIDGKPLFIDKKGDIVFKHNYKSISEFGNNSFATVVTQTSKYGVVNKSGNLVIDTVFKQINAFNNGVAVVTGLNHNPNSNDSTDKVIYEKGVIDTLGNWKVKYGEYKDIGEFKNGYAHVELIVERQKGYYDNKGVIDEKGIYKFTVPSKKWKFDLSNDNFYQDIATIEIYSVNPDTVKVWSSRNRYYYKGAINTNGEIILSNTDWDELTPFTFNRAFAKTTSGKWFLIDTKGQIVISQPFDKILYETYRGNPNDIFTNGKAWVKLSSGWVAIDTTGRILTQPKVFIGIHDSRLRRVGDMIIIEEDISVESDKYSFRYGFWNSITNSSIIPTYHDIDINGFNNVLIYAMKDGITYYINSNGEVIWQGTENKTTTLANLNIDFMNRGYFYAYSKPNDKDLGGFGGSDNFPKKISKSVTFTKNKLSVVVHPEIKDTIYGDNNAITVYIGNTTGGKINFNAQDSRLYMKVQALNSEGEWKDIEYLPSSWCGNSYHTLTLDSKYYWKFLTPIYEGEFKTKLRIELKYIDPTNKSEKHWDMNEITVYSNEYEGSINPGQFWNKREYYPSGIMDPYND